MWVRNYELRIRGFGAILLRCIFLCLFFFSLNGFTQTSPKVSSQVDTTFIKIGDQLKFKVIVEVDSTDLVIFPEGQKQLKLMPRIPQEKRIGLLY